MLRAYGSTDATAGGGKSRKSGRGAGNGKGPNGGGGSGLLSGWASVSQNGDAFGVLYDLTATVAKLNDDDRNTGGCATNTPAWIKVDLGATYSLTSINITGVYAGPVFGETGGFLIQGDTVIQVSLDDSAWTTLVTIPLNEPNLNNTTGYTITFAQSARYVRVYRAAANRVGLGWVKIYGS